MSDAFKCDGCVLLDRGDPYKDGEPTKQLYEQNGHDRGQRPIYSVFYDLCEECADEMGETGDPDE